MDKDQLIVNWLRDNVGDAPEGLAERLLGRLSEARPQKRAHALRWALAGSLAVAVIVGAAALVPRIALARTLGQVHSAIVNARTMRVDLYLSARGAENRHIASIWYENGNWREIGRLGTVREITTLWLQGSNQYWVYYPRLRIATVEPEATAQLPPPVEGQVDAVEFAKRITDCGPMNVPRNVRIEPGNPINGRPTFRIVSERNDSLVAGAGTRASILVDSQTDLPIEARVLTTEPPLPGWTPARSDEALYKFSFNQRADTAGLKPDFGAGVHVVDLPKEWARLRRQWTKPLFIARAEDRTLDVCDVQVSKDGEVFMTYAVNFDGTAVPLAPTELTDDAGARYVRWPMDYRPGGNSPDSAEGQALSFAGKSTLLAYWVPLKPQTAVYRAKRLRFTFGIRPAQVIEAPGSPAQPEPPDVKISWSTTAEASRGAAVPDVVIAFGLAWPLSYPQLEEASLRGNYYFETLRDYERALAWFRRANQLSLDVTIRRPSMLHARDIVQCLEALGRKDEAAAERKRFGIR